MSASENEEQSPTGSTKPTQAGPLEERAILGSSPEVSTSVEREEAARDSVVGPDQADSGGTVVPASNVRPSVVAGGTPQTMILSNTQKQVDGDAVEHESSQFLSHENWRLAVASVRGQDHERRGVWRDDAFAIEATDGWIVMAIADGLGSETLSRVGARIATTSGVQVLARALDGLRIQPPDAKGVESVDMHRLRVLTAYAALDARYELLREKSRRSLAGDWQQFATTLILMAVQTSCGSEMLSTAIVGDGDVAVHYRDESSKVIDKYRQQAFANTVEPLTHPRIPLDMYARTTVTKICDNTDCIVAMTDGVADDWVPLTSRLPLMLRGDALPGTTGRNEEPLPGLLKYLNNRSEKAAGLQEWLGYKKARSSDDRTLLIVAREGGCIG